MDQSRRPNGPKWIEKDRIRLNESELNLNGPNRKNKQNGPKCTKWTEMDRKKPKWTELDFMDRID